MTSASISGSTPFFRRPRLWHFLLSAAFAGGLVVPVVNWAVGLLLLVWHVFSMSSRGFRGAALGVGTALLALLVTSAVMFFALWRAATAPVISDFWVLFAGYGSVVIGAMALLAFRRFALRSAFLPRRG